MRGVKDNGRDDRGATAVVVALLMAVLLCFTALVVDVGRLYSEKAQLQNGTDAAAFAIAQICAQSESDSRCVDGSDLAAELADSNADDSESSVENVDVDWDSNTVEVVAGAKQTGLAAGKVSLFFAGSFETFAAATETDYSSADVWAATKASWGYPGSGTSMLPLVFQLCDFKTDGSMHWLDLKDNTGNSTPSLTCSSGAPGNFHMVDAPSTGSCEYFYAYSSIATSDPGMGKVKDCASLLEAKLGRVLYIPTFDETQGSGNTGEFRIDGWVAFRIEGFRLPSITRGTIPTGATNFGLYGSFIENSVNAPELQNDGDSNYGVTLVKLIQ